jgi:hypothetical protein
LRQQRQTAAPGADVNDSAAAGASEQIESASAKPARQRFEYGLIHGNVIVPQGGLLVWLERVR